MAKVSYPWNSINGDRKYPAEAINVPFSLTYSNGIFKNYGNLLQVAATTGRGIKIKTGAAVINGTFYVNDEEENLTIDLGDPIYSRWDRIVLRMDKTLRSIDIKILKGTPSSTPIYPAHTRTESTYDLVLADIRIVKGATSITQGNIIDRRGFNAFCGWAEQNSQLNTDTLFEGFTAKFNEEINKQYAYYDSNKNKLTGDLGLNLSNIITEAQEGETSLKNNLNNNYVKKVDSGIGGTVPPYNSANTYKTGFYAVGSNYMIINFSDGLSRRIIGVDKTNNRGVVYDGSKYVNMLDEKNNIFIEWEDTAKALKDENGNIIAVDSVINYANGFKEITGWLYLTKAGGYSRDYILPTQQQGFDRVINPSATVIGNANPTLQFEPYKDKNGKWHVKVLAMDSTRDYFNISFCLKVKY